MAMTGASTISVVIVNATLKQWLIEAAPMLIGIAVYMAKGSYWESGGKVFSTSDTTKFQNPRSGKWESSPVPTPEMQKSWIQRRFIELLEKGHSKDSARKIIEGQVLEQGRNPNWGNIKKAIEEAYENL